jgi:hypothetical protein
MANEPNKKWIILILLTWLTALLMLTKHNFLLRVLANSEASVSVAPLVIANNGSYQLVINNVDPPYSGPIKLRSWICLKTNPKDCTQPVEYENWLQYPTNNPYLFQNNILNISLAEFNIPEKLYYAQYAIPGSAYMNPIATNISRFVPTHPYTMNNLTQKLQTAITTLVNNSAFEAMPGVNGITLGAIKAQSTDPDDYVRKAMILMCGSYPDWTKPELYREERASYSTCSAATSYMMMLNYAELNDQTYINAFAYQIIYHMDILSTQLNELPLSGIDSPALKLLDTAVSRSYINDFGMGVFAGLGWLNQQNKISQYYCTSVEKPNDESKNCKTIDLHQRISEVARRVVERTDPSEHLFRNDPIYLGWNAAGRAVAAKVSGDPAIDLATILQTGDIIISKELCTYGGTGENCLSVDRPNELFYRNSNDPYPILPYDTYQHIQSLINASDWQVPENFKTKSPIFRNSFNATYFDQTTPFIKLAIASNGVVTDIFDTYNEQMIKSKLGDNAVQGCGASSPFNKTSFDTVTGARGESASDAVLSSSFSLYYLLDQAGYPELAQEVLNIAGMMAEHLFDYVNRWQDDICGGSMNGSIPKTELSIKARKLSYLYFELMAAKQTHLKPFYKDIEVTGTDYLIWFKNYGQDLSGMDYVSFRNSFL